MRSPIAAAVSRNAANGNVYALTNHCRSASDAPRSVRITGSAVLTTRLSSVTMKVGMPTAAITAAVGRLRGRAGAGGSSTAVMSAISPCCYPLITTDVSY
jgi:hypothetical protein